VKSATLLQMWFMNYYMTHFSSRGHLSRNFLVWPLQNIDHIKKV